MWTAGRALNGPEHKEMISPFTVVTTHTTFPPVFIWTIVSHCAHCLSESSLDRHSRHSEFQQQAKMEHLRAKLFQPFPWQVSQKQAAKMFLSVALVAWCPAASLPTWWLRLHTASTRLAYLIPLLSPLQSNRNPVGITSAPPCRRKGT